MSMIAYRSKLPPGIYMLNDGVCCIFTFDLQIMTSTRQFLFDATLYFKRNLGNYLLPFFNIFSIFFVQPKLNFTLFLVKILSK